MYILMGSFSIVLDSAAAAAAIITDSALSDCVCVLTSWAAAISSCRPVCAADRINRDRWSQEREREYAMLTRLLYIIKGKSCIFILLMLVENYIYTFCF